MDAEWWAYVQGVVLGGFVAGTICYYMGRYYESRRISIMFDVEAVNEHVVIHACRRR